MATYVYSPDLDRMVDKQTGEPNGSFHQHRTFVEIAAMTELRTLRTLAIAAFNTAESALAGGKYFAALQPRSPNRPFGAPEICRFCCNRSRQKASGSIRSIDPYRLTANVGALRS